MAEGSEPLDVKRVYEARVLHNDEPVEDNRRQRRQQDQQPLAQHQKRETQDFFSTMEKAAKKSNEVLMQRGAPLRFTVYRKGGDVYIDLVRLDEHGQPTQTTTRKITHQDFDRWIEDVAQVEGLFLDTQV
jgi:hypothetical protein